MWRTVIKCENSETILPFSCWPLVFSLRFAIPPFSEFRSFSPRKIATFRSCPGKPNQRKGQNEKLMNFAHFCEFWWFALGKQARFTLNFCSGMPLRIVHELAFLWFGLPGRLPKNSSGISGPEGFPKNLLRLFWRNRLARLKITSEIKNNLKKVILVLVLQGFFRALLKTTLEIQNNFEPKLALNDAYGSCEAFFSLCSQYVFR